MRFYSLSYSQMLDLPIRTFWHLSNSINRLSADEDIRRLDVFSGAQTDKGLKFMRDKLKDEIGDLTRQSPQGDLSALRNLKSKIARQQRPGKT